MLSIQLQLHTYIQTQVRQPIDQWRAEGLGCPGPTRFLDAHQLKKQISPRLFLLFPQNYLPKILTTFFSNFSQFLLFLSEHLSGCPPYPGCPGPFFTFHAFTLTFSTFTYAFFQKTPSLDGPPSGCPGLSHPPLHATG